MDHHDHLAPTAAIPAAVDPVCGMRPKPTTPHRSTYRGQAFVFCSAGCNAKFEADPARYLAGAAEPKPPAPAKPPPPAQGSEPLEAPIYTCPMHPEVRKAGPGSCPICGMALEPLVITAEEARRAAQFLSCERQRRHRGLRGLRRRLYVAAHLRAHPGVNSVHALVKRLAQLLHRGRRLFKRAL